jgi:hypothetical protein
MRPVEIGWDRQRAARDLVEVQRDGPGQPAGGREDPAAAVARVGRVRDDRAIEQILPVGLELADVGDDAAGGAPLLRPHRPEQHDLVAALDHVARPDLRRDEPLAVHLDQRQAHLEVLRHQLGLRAASLLERDRDRRAAHHDVVDRQDQTRRIDHDAAAEPLVAEDTRRGMIARDLRVYVHDALQEMTDELDGGVHRVAGYLPFK